MIPDLFENVAGFRPIYHDAQLADYSVRALKDRAYPGLIRQAGEQANGLLIHGISPKALERLDQYEGPEYELGWVTVSSEGKRVQALTYLLGTNFQHLALEQGWQLK